MCKSNIYNTVLQIYINILDTIQKKLYQKYESMKTASEVECSIKSYLKPTLSGHCFKLGI